MNVNQADLSELVEQLETIISVARTVQDSRVNTVKRQYRELVNAAEKFDKLAKDFGIDIARELDVDLSSIRENEDLSNYESATHFFWRNEMFRHEWYVDELDSNTVEQLDTTYTLPFSYEVSGAYNAEEMVDRARTAIDISTRTKEKLENIQHSL